MAFNPLEMRLFGTKNINLYLSYTQGFFGELLLFRDNFLLDSILMTFINACSLLFNVTVLIKDYDY